MASSYEINGVAIKKKSSFSQIYVSDTQFLLWNLVQFYLIKFIFFNAINCKAVQIMYD